MTDKEILGTIYGWLTQANSRDENPDHTRKRLRDFQSFIEQEWQKRDEQELVDQHNRNRKLEDYIMDVSEIERHRGLEIGSDGTVI